jgi:hypothetical protein
MAIEVNRLYLFPSCGSETQDDVAICESLIYAALPIRMNLVHVAL